MSLKKQVGIHGRRAFVTSDDILVGRGGLAVGGEGKPSVMYGGPETISIFEDFHVVPPLTAYDTGSNYAGEYFALVRGDTGAAGAHVAGTNGIFRLTPDSDPAAGAPSTACAGVIGQQLNWKANAGADQYSGNLRMGARIRQSVVTRATGMNGWFVGFTDVVTAEVPCYDTGTTGGSVTPATNACGIFWGNRGDTGFRGFGADGDSDQFVTLTTTAQTLNTWVTLEIDVHRGVGDTGGTATFYVDGVPKGSISNPFNMSTALTPCIYSWDTGQAGVLDIDWINVTSPRDTGS